MSDMETPTEYLVEQTKTEVIRLPLWKACLDEMRKNCVEYGKVYATEYFEAALKCQRDSMEFGLAVSNIRRELEKDGYYLTGRGQKLTQFIILPPEANRNVMAAYSRAATDALTRGVVLGTNTRMDVLTAEDRRRHESLLEKMAVKLALCRRPFKFAKLLPKKDANLLGQ